MWEDLKNLTSEFFSEHRDRKIGFTLGILIGAAILTFGFFDTLFAFFCGVIGLYIGSRFDRGDDLIERTLKRLEKILPDRVRYW